MTAPRTQHAMPAGMEPIANIGLIPEFLQNDKAQVICYQSQIPEFAGFELERLYGSTFSSLQRLHIWGDSRDVNTYVVKRNDVVKTILLFRFKGDEVQVVNEVIMLHEEEIQQFAQYIFATYMFAKVIFFMAIHTDLQKLPFPYHKYNCNENIVASLPATTQEYWSRLGKSTRQNITRYRNKLSREMSSSDYKVYETDDIQERQFRQIVELSKARLSRKNKTLGWSEEDIERLIKLAKVSGLMGVITVDGKICAGIVCYRAGANYFLEVIAHDPELDEYRLGKLCCYYTICACIERGAKEFHFLWGKNDYKYRFLGVQRNLDRIVIYRSPVQQLLHGRVALETASQGLVRQMKIWVHSDEAKQNPMGRVAIQCIRGLQSLKGRAPIQRQDD